MTAPQPFRRLALFITNLIKVAGLGIAVHEVFWLPQPRALELSLAAFMMAGAQIGEDVILQLAGRLFGHGTSEGRPESKP